MTKMHTVTQNCNLSSFDYEDEPLGILFQIKTQVIYTV